MLKRSFPRLFENYQPLPVDDYPRRLLDALRHSAPAGISDPTVVLLTPGIYNSAYFEHTVLARRMGVELVEGGDLLGARQHRVHEDDQGPPARRRDLSPHRRRLPRSAGVQGRLDARRDGLDERLPRRHVAIANAVGTGVADDKAIYPFVPDIIRFYLGEEPILPNVPTYDCTDDLQRRYVTSHLDELVVKNTNQSGGYGMLMGPSSIDDRARALQRGDRGVPARLHRPADHPALVPSDRRRRNARAAAHRFAAVRADERRGRRSADRADARRADRGFAGRELIARRRQQRYLDLGRLR